MSCFGTNRPVFEAFAFYPFHTLRAFAGHLWTEGRVSAAPTLDIQNSGPIKFGGVGIPANINALVTKNFTRLAEARTRVSLDAAYMT
jgi:hypothetical protein